EKACTLAALEDLMSAHGICAPASQKRLTRFLNELGEIIHYPDNPVLRDTIILDAEWVSQTISLVLDNDEVLRGLGYYRRETMEKIWRHLGVGMPERMLNLMEEFDLSYRTLDDRDISIIVERLQQEPPDGWDKHWDAVPSPCQEITMEFKLETALPPGIPSWFIARQHQYTRNTHWRRGAVFADDRQNPKHWALIEAYPEKSLLRLTVRGPVPYDFFARLRRGLWETFNRYEGLREGKFRVVETVPCPGKLEGAHCTYEHDLTDLERGRNTMTCNRCDEKISVPELLLGIRFEPTYEKLEAIHADVCDTREKVEEIHSLVSNLQGSHAELFNAFQHIEEMQSPYIFVLRTGAYDSDLTGLFHGTGVRGNAISEMRHRLWKEKMELQLYCQQPGYWHPLGYNRGKDDPATGLYQIEVNGELLMLLAPYLPKLAKLLKYAKPFAQAAKAMAGLPPVAPEVEGLRKIIESDYGMMERLVKNLPSPEELTKQSEKIRSLEDSAEAKMMRGLGDAANPTEARGVLLRQLRRLLLEKDKDQIWGGLQRKYVKAEGHHLWLCPHHLAEYKQ
nr:hypothetical protein [Acidobacteriota bacterium]